MTRRHPAGRGGSRDCALRVAHKRGNHWGKPSGGAFFGNVTKVIPWGNHTALLVATFLPGRGLDVLY